MGAYVEIRSTNDWTTILYRHDEYIEELYSGHSPGTIHWLKVLQKFGIDVKSEYRETPDDYDSDDYTEWMQFDLWLHGGAP